jgi:hypothetical protein
MTSAHGWHRLRFKDVQEVEARIPAELLAGTMVDVDTIDARHVAELATALALGQRELRAQPA